jgi:hypothetical protein
MKRVVWKYAVPYEHRAPETPPHVIPVGSRVLLCAPDPETAIPTVWIELDPEEQNKTERLFVAYGTGRQVPPDMDHVGSLVSYPFVWHVYEQRKG